MTDRKSWRLATQAVHVGRPKADADFIPTITPIHPSVTYRYPSMDALDEVFAGTRKGYVYARYGSPTLTALEEAVALLEGGEAALALASGMAAIHVALLALGARSGSAVVAAQDIYGATYTLLDQLMRTQGVTVRFVEADDLEAVNKACVELRPVALLVETISNPLLKVANLPALVDVAHRCGAALVVDSTFATPYLVRPLVLGADLVIHSATKYLAGHGDVLGGVVVSSRKLREEMFEVLKATGGNLGPQEAWLALRGMRTLALRMRQHCENALQVARWLDGHARVSRVLYPGLASHPQHRLAGELFGDCGYGGMVSFELAGAGQHEVFRFFEALRLCLPATTLGDVHSLLLYPAHSSHRALSAEERARIGIGEGLVRMSVGIEAIEDLLQDLEAALATLS
jgi:cystathionine beta-lyase/cystathionine gamma-synthase